MTRLELARNKILIHAEEAEVTIRCVSNYLAMKDADIALQLRGIAAKIRDARIEHMMAQEAEDYSYHQCLKEEHAAEDAAWRAGEAKP